MRSLCIGFSNEADDTIGNQLRHFDRVPERKLME